MKTMVMKIAVLGIIFASAAQFLGATVWEGVSSAVVGGDLPGTYSVATNSFPRNTVVEITNLENGKKVRAIVVLGLDSTGLLAVLSKNAADSIGLQNNFTCRIRMTQAANASASSIAALGPILPLPFAADPSRNRAASRINNPSNNESSAAGSQAAIVQSEPEPIIGYAEYMNGIADDTAGADDAYTDDDAYADELNDHTSLAATPASPADSYTEAAEVGKPDNHTDLASYHDSSDTGNRADSVAAAVPAEPVSHSEPAPTQPSAAQPLNPSAPVSRNNRAEPPATQPTAAQPTTAQPTAAQPVSHAEPAGYTAAGNTTAVPADHPQPVSRSEPPAVSRNNRAAEVQPAAVQPEQSGARLVMLPSEERLPTPINQNTAPAARPETSSRAAVVPSANFSPFQAPLVSRLEQGKWYVQLGAYKRVDHVEDEISRIGPAYPVAIQNVGTDTDPMFRILLGPLNQGESGAMLQRVKSIGYADAFVRHN